MRSLGISSVLAILLVFTATNIYASYGQRLCKTPGYHCQRVHSGQSWESMFPDDHDRGIVMRVNRMNTQVWAGQVIAVPKNLSNADIMDFAPFPKYLSTAGEKLIVVDPNAQAWGAYDATGNLLRWGPASSGADYCRDIDKPCRTNGGSYRVFSLGSSDCFSTKFPLPDGGAPMPYCMYFSDGQALHGEPSGLPGYNASHGCVRMYVSDAEWMRYDFVEGPNSNNKFRGTRILVRNYDGEL